MIVLNMTVECFVSCMMLNIILMLIWNQRNLHHLIQASPDIPQDLDDSIEKTKRTKIEHYFHAHNDICEIQNEQRSFNNVSGITLVPPDELLQDAPSNLSDLEKDVENSYLQELSVETLNPTIERLIRLKEGIARYRITFLPEFHLNDPVKRLFTDKEWIIMQSKWRKIEEEIVNTSNHF
ncbi:hypothetical protein RhiirC2_871916 [Rhizophagus irregularis]|uniref:Uncharacterized protein n=1 Tax=Rhizophagus irregularis TaxID=588596 RepID=A0A2N1M5V7_9GLOM|nr:hypothetical protein RhiirC2_871916 [Rhizophagus irregularis]